MKLHKLIGTLLICIVSTSQGMQNNFDRQRFKDQINQATTSQEINKLIWGNPEYGPFGIKFNIVKGTCSIKADTDYFRPLQFSKIYQETVNEHIKLAKKNKKEKVVQDMLSVLAECFASDIKPFLDGSYKLNLQDSKLLWQQLENALGKYRIFDCVSLCSINEVFHILIYKQSNGTYKEPGYFTDPDKDTAKAHKEWQTDVKRLESFVQKYTTYKQDNNKSSQQRWGISTRGYLITSIAACFFAYVFYYLYMLSDAKESDQETENLE